MSKRTFCDLCDSPVDPKQNGSPNFEYEASSRVLGDKSAKVCIRISFGYHRHSTGYGGPPDLCNKCRVNLLKAALGRINP
jgi:hypothetical protein